VSVVEADRRAALEEQRDFLLRSLEDLEREHEAGDVDEHDYVALKDDYTARAAAVLRALQAPAGAPPRPAARRGALARGVVPAVLVLAFAVLAGVLVAQAAGRRDSGEVVTGGIRQSITEKLNEAGRRGSAGEVDAAIELYDEVLADDPANAEAATYKGWLQTLSGDDEAGLESLLAAATAHPEYPDVHAFLAIVFFRNGLVAQAANELDRLDRLDPPAAIRDLTADLRARVAAAATTTTTTTTP
jgi:tetratricopeptide (TPR) repeat protein